MPIHEESINENPALHKLALLLIRERGYRWKKATCGHARVCALPDEAPETLLCRPCAQAQQQKEAHATSERYAWLYDAHKKTRVPLAVNLIDGIAYRVWADNEVLGSISEDHPCAAKGFRRVVLCDLNGQLWSAHVPEGQPDSTSERPTLFYPGADSNELKPFVATKAKPGVKLTTKALPAPRGVPKAAVKAKGPAGGPKKALASGKKGPARPKARAAGAR